MDSATEAMVFDLVMTLIKAGVAKYEEMKAGKTTAAQAHADITATIATLAGAVAGNDQMIDLEEANKYPGTL